MSMQLVSDRTENIEAKIGCIKLKGVLHHYIYDNGYESDMVEMTVPYPGKKRALFDRKVNVVREDVNYTPEAIALKKIYKQELEIRRRQRYLERNKEKIAELLPIWFEYDALIGYFDATERIGIRAITRLARRGDISAKEANKELSLIRNHLHKDREREKYDFTKDMNRSLRVTGLQNLEFDYGDACRLFGEKVWEQHLERTQGRVTDVAEIDDVAMHLFNDFSFLYNIELPKIEEGDMVETIGFGGVMIAVAVYRNGEIVGVGAMDDVRGRRALCKLVGDKRLAEILPKKVYNAITRQEPFSVRGSLCYRRLNANQVITIQ
jgi:hypothetical protein